MRARLLLVLGIVFVSSGLRADDEFVLHSEPGVAKQVRLALGEVGNLSSAQLAHLLGNDREMKDLVLSMVDPMVHRQGSPTPFDHALKGPGFPTFDSLMSTLNKNANADLFPRLTTKLWSEELRRKLFPLIESNHLGKKVGDEYELTAAEVAKLVLEIFPGDITPLPPPGFDAKNFTPPQTLNTQEWEELRDYVGELALSYRRALRARTTSGARSAPGLAATH